MKTNNTSHNGQQMENMMNNRNIATLALQSFFVGVGLYLLVQGEVMTALLPLLLVLTGGLAWQRQGDNADTP